jgi:hypothetical protein
MPNQRKSKVTKRRVGELRKLSYRNSCFSELRRFLTSFYANPVANMITYYVNLSYLCKINQYNIYISDSLLYMTLSVNFSIGVSVRLYLCPCLCPCPYPCHETKHGTREIIPTIRILRDRKINWRFNVHDR